MIQDAKKVLSNHWQKYLHQKPLCRFGFRRVTVDQVAGKPG